MLGCSVPSPPHPGSSVVVDARWLFEFESRLFDALGQRLDVAGLCRWSNPDTPRLRDANHAAVRADDGLIPDQLVQVFDAQQRDGARRRCVDVYGARDERDALCLEMGLAQQPAAPAMVLLFDRQHTPPVPPPKPGDKRTAPPLVRVDPRDWVDAVTRVHGGSLAPWQREHAMAEATIPEACFYAIRIGDACVTAVARYDWAGASQIASMYTDPAFRKTGFGRAALATALHGAPNDIVFGIVDGDNRPMLTVARRASVEVGLTDARRRYVGEWG